MALQPHNEIGDLMNTARFHTTEKDGSTVDYDGQVVTILRSLDPEDPRDNVDPEVGNMFRVKAENGFTFDAFEDELEIL